MNEARQINSQTLFLGNAVLTINPNNHYREDLNFLFEWMGLLPHWINMLDKRSFKEQLETAYGFPCYWHKQGNIDKELVYHYPEDPSLYPIGMIERLCPKQEVVLFYPNGIVGIINMNNPDEHKLCGRMD